jgi:hypothetical protein
MAEKSKDCCKDGKQTAGKSDCIGKDGKKMADCNGTMKSDCCSKNAKKADASNAQKDKDKK